MCFFVIWLFLVEEPKLVLGNPRPSGGLSIPEGPAGSAINPQERPAEHDPPSGFTSTKERGFERGRPIRL